MMIKTMFFSGLFLFLTSPANAALVTLKGGTIKASASAGMPDKVSDQPAPATPQLGFTSVSASAAGFYDSFGHGEGGIPDGSWPVDSLATASVDAVQNASGGLDLQLSAFANASSLWEGLGMWAGAGSSSSAEVLISVAGPTRMVLNWTGVFGLQSSSGAGFNGNGVHWNFYGFVPDPPFDPNPFGDEPSTTLLLQAGQYTASVSADANAFGSDSILTLSFTPVPVPAAFWLLGSALAGCIGFVRRQPVKVL